jgi:hypothetical protein
MMMKGPIRELIPVGEQTVRVLIPKGKQVGRVHLLRAGITPSVRHDADGITVQVPSILEHEVIAIDWA